MEKSQESKLRKLAKRIEGIEGCSNVIVSTESFSIELEFISLTDYTFKEISVYAHNIQIKCTSWFLIPIANEKGLLHLAFYVPC
jgi:hypothetical protein